MSDDCIVHAKSCHYLKALGVPPVAFDDYLP